MFEQLNADDSVVVSVLERVGDDVSGEDFKISDAFGVGSAVDVFFLGVGVGESHNFRVWEDFGKVKGR